MSILDNSKKHSPKRVNFAAGGIEQMSSISKPAEEKQFNFDNVLRVSSQYEVPSDRLSLTAIHSRHEYQHGKNIPSFNERQDTNPFSFNLESEENLHMKIPNAEIPIQDKSIQHQHQSVSFSAGIIKPIISSLSRRAEEKRISSDNFLYMPSQFDLTSERFSINAHHNMHEDQQSNSMKVSLLNTNTKSTPTNRDVNSQMQNVCLVSNTYDQNFLSSSIENEEFFSTFSLGLESSVSIEQNIVDAIPWFE